MSYVEDHLLPGERIVHRAHLHRIGYIVPALLFAAIETFALWMVLNGQYLWGAITAAVGLLPVLWAWIDFSSSEFAVTDKRVVIKVGFIQRRTLETMLNKVENVGVDQSVLGRVLDYGTITVTGTGGTQERFPNIGAPLEFRRQVQSQIAAGDVDPQLAVPRDERECPHCAERILRKARVCKHCGRDVESVIA